MPGMDAMPMEMGESPGGIDKKLSGNHEQKTRFFIKPNLMQLHSSYVVTDPKGTVLVECGKLLSRGSPRLGKDGKPLRNKKGKIIYEPYQIKVFNTINFKKSMHYNPFAYLHSEKDILKLVTVLIANTKGEGKSGDDFWVKAETLLYTALIGAMICGRIINGVLNALIFNAGKYSMEMWLTASFLQAIPGIVIQLALIPLLVLALQKARLADRAGAARV